MKRIADIPGILPSFHSAQLLVSSGLSSLDEFIGGGIPLGTVVLLEEDKLGVYSKIILKYFLAEGIVNKHSTLLASLDTNPQNILNQLPSLITEDVESEGSTQGGDRMKIAFRYHNLPTSEKQPLHKFGHYYDLSRYMPERDINISDVNRWSRSALHDSASCESNGVFKSSSYYKLLETIKENIHARKLFLSSGSAKARSILRVGIHALGSPLWFGEQQCSTSAGIEDLNLFLISLRALMRAAFAVAFVTVPSHLYKTDAIKRCIHCSDIALRLQTFSGTELEHNRYLSDYQGFFYVEKVAAINSFVSKHPGSIELAFKLRRKKFVIEKLHLPPDIEDTSSKKKGETPMMGGCGAGGSRLLDF